MKKLMKMLPILGLVLAAVFAFAFTNPMVTPSNAYGTTNGGATWYNVTGLTMGPGPNQYNCNQAFPSDQCLYLEKSTSDPIENSNGRFVPGANLIPE